MRVIAVRKLIRISPWRVRRRACRSAAWRANEEVLRMLDEIARQKHSCLHQAGKEGS